MIFVNRHRELARLDRVAKAAKQGEGSLVVIWGRRRIGKTRLLLEWTQRTGGLFWVAEESAAPIQRQYFAEAVAAHLAGFADVEYRDWASLLSRLASDAAKARWW